MAKNNVYALFVGVDSYDRTSGISHLSGCVNDAKRMMAYLDENIDNDQYDFHPVTLFSERGNTDEATLPTRANILDKFKTHLINNVKKDDYAIFFYAGHGTTEPAHPYFKEPTETVQALVPYDARVKKNGQEIRCILDKEIRFLIRKLWERSDNCENIIFIQDSCHSAGASRMAEAVKSINDAMNKAKEAGIEGVETFEENRKEETEKIETPPTRGANSSNYPQEVLDQLSDSDQNVLRIYKNGPPKGSDLAKKLEALMAEYAQNNTEENTNLQEENATENVEKTPIETQPKPRFLAPNGAGHIKWETEGEDAIAQIRSLYNGFTLDDDNIQSRGGGNDSQKKQPFDVAFPQGNHLHLAACSSHQYAYEVKHTDPVTKQAYRGGVFTNTILSLLQKSNSNISYHDLFNRAKLSIDGVFKQTPDMYVKGDSSKRFGLFLGDIIKRKGAIGSSTYNLTNNSKEGWFIDAGELQGLPRIEGKISFIPVYVYELGADEANLETRAPNAYLSSVLAQKSMLEVDATKLNEQGEPLLTLDGEKLYKAYISPKWHRRRRVRVALAKPAIEHNLVNCISSKENVTLVENLQDADYSIRTEKGSYLLSKINNGQEELLSTAKAFMETVTKIKYFDGRKQETVTTHFKKVAIQNQWNDEREEWIYTDGTTEKPADTSYEYGAGYNEAATNRVIDILLKENGEGQVKIKLYPTESTNPFEEWKAKNASQLSYYNSFINWVDNPEENPAKIDYWLAYDGARYSVYANGDEHKIPVFKQTINLEDEGAWEVISSLQHMTKWYTLAGFKNKIQKEVFKNRDLTLQLTAYQKGGASEVAPKVQITIDLQRGVYQIAGQAAKPLFSKEAKGIQDEGLFFLRNKSGAAKPVPGYYQESTFKYDLVFTNSEKPSVKPPAEIDQKLYVSMLVMDDSYSINTMQGENGCEAVPMRKLSNTNDDGAGQITINNIFFDMPQAMKDNSVVNKTQMLLKIFVAFASFDISKYLQDALEPAIDFNRDMLVKETLDGVDKTRGLVNVRPRSADPGAWAAFHIPIIINRDAPQKEIPIINNNPDGLMDDEDSEF